MAKNPIVMFFTDDDGFDIDNPVWHLIDPGNPAGHAALCTGEFFGVGESSIQFSQTEGEITCPNCISKIRKYKKVKL